MGVVNLVIEKGQGAIGRTFLYGFCLHCGPEWGWGRDLILSSLSTPPPTVCVYVCVRSGIAKLRMPGGTMKKP